MQLSKKCLGLGLLGGLQNKSSYGMLYDNELTISLRTMHYVYTILPVLLILLCTSVGSKTLPVAIY